MQRARKPPRLTVDQICEAELITARALWEEIEFRCITSEMFAVCMLHGMPLLIHVSYIRQSRADCKLCLFFPPDHLVVNA